MRLALLALLCLCLGGCLSARLSPGGEGVDIGLSYPASADRVAQVEDSLQRARSEVDESISQTREDTRTLVAGAQADLQSALDAFDKRTQDMSATAEAQRDQLREELESFDLTDLLGEDVLSWVLAILGIGGIGTVGSTMASRKRRGVGLLSGKPKTAAPKA